MKEPKQRQRKINKQSGAAMLITVVFFVFISLAIISGLVAPSIREFKTATDSLRSRQSFFLSESGAEDAFYRLKEALPIGASETLTLNGNTATTTITTNGAEKTISTVGDVFSRQRKSELVLSAGTGASFSYGVQSGQGGFIMDNNSQINGSVYSNGNIEGGGFITGSATSANSGAIMADQTNDTGTPSYDVIFGNTNTTQDFAQSFMLSTTDVVNKVQLYLKKVNTPGDLTVRIVSDTGGSPSPSNIPQITSGPLSSSLVSTNYGWVDVPFSTNPQLVAGTRYWLVIDGGTNISRYYIVGANSGVYLSGTGKIGQYNNNLGSWNDTIPAGLDGFFKIYLGGLTGLISGVRIGSFGVGNAYAHTINSANVAGTKYCQSTDSLPMCNTSLADPVQIPMSISDQNILDWKAEAEAGGIYTGNYTVSGTVSLGPKKITGNLTVSNNANLIVTGTLWVQGNIITNEGDVELSSSYGSGDGIIVADGTVTIGNHSDFTGSGDPDSFIMLLTTSTSSSAIDLQNNGGAEILYAGNGTIYVHNNATAKALTGKSIHMGENSTIDYESGLINANFTNGPSGSWGVNSWREVSD